MHCDCCDRLLNEQETSDKFPSGEYVNMCGECQKTLPPDVRNTIQHRMDDLREPKDYPETIDYPEESLTEQLEREWEQRLFDEGFVDD